MKTIIFILFSFSLLANNSKEEGVLIVEYKLDKSTLDSELASNESVFKFTFHGILNFEIGQIIEYSFNGKTAKQKLNNARYFELKVQPGNYKFQFFINTTYFEIYTDSLEIKSRYRDDYSIHFQDAINPVVVDKPVIYLYPENETDVEVKLNIHGQKPFFYPAYDDGWRIKASPDGTITHNGSTYNYLFWESNQVLGQNTLDWTTGFVVQSNEIVSFLEEQLTKFGLTSKEKADFITFWAPKMIRHPSCLVHFELNENCNKFAELNIKPEPDQLNRIYIFWSSVNDVKDFSYLRGQELQPINRLGFTVLEWGGAEVQQNWEFENGTEL